MSSSLLAILRNHDYWRQTWAYGLKDPRFRALDMIHRPSPGAVDKRKQNRADLKGWRRRPITYDTMHMLRGDRPERII